MFHKLYSFGKHFFVIRYSKFSKLHFRKREVTKKTQRYFPRYFKLLTSYCDSKFLVNRNSVFMKFIFLSDRMRTLSSFMTTDETFVAFTLTLACVSLLLMENVLNNKYSPKCRKSKQKGSKIQNIFRGRFPRPT